MDKVTTAEIEQFRDRLAAYPPALKALDTIEDCEGDLEDAAISLAIRAGQEPQQNNADWLASLAKRCRAAICQDILRENLQNGAWDKAAIALANLDLIPEILATPVLIYVLKQGVEEFCEPLDRV
ncbi:hypothetical protein IQ249_01645 [Lusitaniella coriacea LEGE 07157]|uniref:Uncharacterized protein n=1 Tax=Lusitaniella coriacea LEGE 07157 TaxID=945747 RepID=A0A8J7B6N1_9CYAN|nr:hypothetical protein [Lusitaniella coriacea]MBE9114589.1 hypothetical protein [Lusitaniella coriacea LEGE 07157]